MDDKTMLCRKHTSMYDSGREQSVSDNMTYYKNIMRATYNW